MQGNEGRTRHRTPVPKLVEASQAGKITILWNQQVQTDRTIPQQYTGHHNTWY